MHFYFKEERSKITLLNKSLETFIQIETLRTSVINSISNSLKKYFSNPKYLL